MINDKSDGVLDHLLPHTRIVVREAHQGCAQGLVRGALTNLASAMPEMIATLASCSNDIAEVSDAVFRADPLANPVKYFPRFVVFSASSTAPSLSDEVAFPNLARLVSNEDSIAMGMTALARKFGWKRLAVLHDSTLWGRETARAFIRAFKYASDTRESGVVLNEDAMEFDLSALDAGALDVTSILASVKASGVAMVPRGLSGLRDFTLVRWRRREWRRSARGGVGRC